MNIIPSVIPSMSKFLPPILRWASKRQGEFHRSEAMEAMAIHFKLSLAAKRELTGKRNMPRYKDRTSRAISHLKQAGLLELLGKGYYEITDAGKEEAFFSGDAMTTTYLSNNFSAYRIWQEGNSRK